MAKANKQQPAATPATTTAVVPVTNPASAPRAVASLAALYTAGTLYKGPNKVRADFCAALAALPAPVTGQALLDLPAAQAVLADRGARYKAHKSVLAQVGFFVTKGWVKQAE
jgi:hypothetical protein